MKNRYLKEALCIGLFCSGGVAAADGPVEFGERIIIDSSTINPRTVVYGDMDRDGDNDLVVSYTNGNKILWYENNLQASGGFIQRVVDASAQDTREVWVDDVTGDGALDIVSVSFVGSVRVYESDGQPTPGFTKHVVAIAPTGWSVCAADFDRDGDLDLAAVEKAETRAVHWYRNNGGLPTTWEKISIDDNMVVGEKIIPADIDADGDEDILVASFGLPPGGAPPFDPLDGLLTWYRNDGAEDPAFERITIDSLGYGGKWVETADFDGDGDLDIAAVNQQINSIEWWQSDGAPTPSFTRRFITSLVQVKGAKATDLDFDGDIDLIANGIVTDEILFLENTGGMPPVFARHVVTDDQANPLTAIPVDLDRDGDIDIASVSFVDGTVNWFYNQSPPIGLSFTDPPVITSAGDGPSAMRAADIDRDGRQDVVIASELDGSLWWQRNLGGSPVAFEQRLITSAFSAFTDISIADLDHDGDLDVVTASPGNNAVVWHRNDGGVPVVFTSTAVGGVIPGAHALEIADFDRDGDADVMVTAAGSNEVYLLENDDAATPSFSSRVIASGVLGPLAISLGDMNQDGAVDAAVSARDSDSLVLLINDTTSMPSFTVLALGGALASPLTVATVDYDSDGDLDLLSGSSLNNTLTLHENLDPVHLQFALSVLGTAPAGVDSIVAADADHDGDIDIVASGPGAGDVVWYERTADDLLSPQTILASLGQPSAVLLSDVSGDSIPDVLVVDTANDQLLVQVPGTFPIAISAQVAAASISPADIPENTVVPLFSMTIEHQISSKLSSFEVKTIPLSAIDLSSMPMEPAILNTIVRSVAVYMDDGSGDFDPGLDTLLAAHNNPTFDAMSRTSVTFGAGFVLVPGESQDLYVTVEFGSTAAETGAGSFRFGLHPAEIELDEPLSGQVTLEAGPLIQTPLVRAIPSFTGRTVGRRWLRHTIDDSFLGADSVHTADMNDDGLLDMVVGWEQQGLVTMYLNPGPALTTGPWPRTTTGVASGVETAVPVDLDSDGRKDIVIAREFGPVTVHWAPPPGVQIDDPANWTVMPISGIPNERWGPLDVVDIDGENGLDLVFGAIGLGNDFDVPVAWLKAPADPRDQSAWSYHTLGSAGFVTSINGRDMDCDGDQDVVWTNRLLLSTERAAWWFENPGSGPAQSKEWNRHLVGSLGREPMIMDLADIDGDGLEDAAVPDRNFAPDWHRRLDSSGDAWSTHRLNWPADMGRPKAFRIGDIDLDGKPDLIATAIQAVEQSDVVGVCWLKQPANPQSAMWPAFNIGGFGGEKFDRIELVDLDADGDLDVITTEEHNNSAVVPGLGVVWYENPTIELDGDVSGDGFTTSLDLSILLSSWGIEGDPFGTDLNNDGEVDSFDLAILLAAWGHQDLDAQP